jgi:hypothetical protein
MPELTATHGGATVTSTNETQENLNLAVGLNADGSAKGAVVVEEPEPETEVPEVEETETAAESETAKTESEDQKAKGKGGFQKKIAKLTKRAGIAESRAEAAERRAAELEARLADKPAETATSETSAAKSDRPKLAEFSTPDEWADALFKWERAQNAKEAEDAERREVFDTYHERLEEVKAEHDDWEDVFEEMKSEDVKIPESVSTAIIEMEHGPEVAYHLAKNPEMRDKLMRMSAVSAIREVGRIEATLFPESDSDNDSPTKKVETRAPRPLKPVGGSSKSSTPLEELSPDEYIRKRNADIAKRRGR